MRALVPDEVWLYVFPEGDATGPLILRKNHRLDVFDGLPLDRFAGRVARFFSSQTVVPDVPFLLSALEKNVLIAKRLVHNSFTPTETE